MQRRPARHIQSPDLNQTKVTPRTRPVHEAAFDGSLIKADPNKKYVLAPKDEQHPFGYQYYESIGYTMELAAKDGVRIRMGTKALDGKPLEFRGNFLMSCSKERAQEIFEVGANGMTGQKYYDKLMHNIKMGNLEKRVPIQGLQEQWEVSDLEQHGMPQGGVFREE